MRTLTKPSLNHIKVLEACTSNIRDLNLKTRVKTQFDFFRESSESYDAKALRDELSTIPIQDNVNHSISKDEMVFLYNKLVAKGQPGREFYDKILHSSSLCPVCGYRITGSLDHYLPKTIYPAYAVDPLNLIPCCRDCNSKKSDDIPEKGKETLHPYYDEIEEDRWLYAEIEETHGVGFKFYVQKPDNWTVDKFSKLKYHFTIFELSDLYSIYASQEINDQAYFLKHLHHISGSDVIREQLLLFHKSAEKRYINHWKSAMYEALANSEWFCKKGILNFIG